MRVMRVPPQLVLPAHPRILVVSLRRIGDALLTTPLIRSLRRAWPDATIDVLAFPAPPASSKAIRMSIASSPCRRGRRSARPPRSCRALFKRYHLAVSTQPGDRPTFFALLAGRTHAGLTDADGPRLGYLIKRRAASSQRA